MTTRTQIITVLLGLLAGFGGGFLAGIVGHVEPASAVQNQGRLAVLEAGEFRLVDEAGRVRAVLGMDSSSLSYLRLLDLDGHKRVSLSINAAYQTAGIYLYDDTDSPKAVLHTYQKGTSSLSFYRNDVPWAELGNELGFQELGFTPNDASAPPSLKFWKGGAFTGTLNWHAP
jgi:hypothetical protein